MPTIPCDVLIDYAARVLQAAGADEEESQVVSCSLVLSDRCGHHSHGVQRLLEYVPQIEKQELTPGVPLAVLRQMPAVLVCDAQQGFGQVQCRRFVLRLLEQAETEGVASGTLTNCGHVGRLGEWVEMAAARDMAAWMTVNDNGAELCVAPPGAATPVLGTNPLALAVPTNGDPLVLDMSTSVVASGKVTAHRMAGTECPSGWLQDAAGKPTTDPQTLQAEPPGTLLPLGGYKGFGLGLLLDALVGGLSGGNCPQTERRPPAYNNVLMTVWAAAHFSGSDHLRSEASGLAELVRSAAPIETPDGAAAKEPRLPGDHSRRARQTHSDSVPIESGVWSALQQLGRRLGVDALDEPLQ